ncbi:MAG: YbbR-like domain-containing protein [Anaerolineae bacterium]
MIKAFRFILENLFTLLLSLMLAILIWANAVQEEDPIQREFLPIPVNFVGQMDGSLLETPENADSQTVQAIFEGPASIVTQLTAADFSATVDLSQVVFGEDTAVPILVQPKNNEVVLLSQSPEQINVRVELLVTQEVPILLDVRGEVARGHTQGEALLNPETITISGPASAVSSFDFARVTVFLNDDRQTFFDTTQPIFYDKQGRVASIGDLTLSTEQVEVTIPINESAGFGEKIITADLVGEPAPGYRILSVVVQPPSVLVQGTPSRVNNLTSLNTEQIDITGLTESIRQQVALALPDGVELDESVEIFVDIEIEPFRSTSSVQRPLELQGLGDDLAATVDPTEVRVILFGPLPVLDALQDNEVRVTVDLFGLDVGTHTLEPSVTLPDRGIELRSVQPAQVTVAITHAVTITNGLTESIETAVPTLPAPTPTPSAYPSPALPMLAAGGLFALLPTIRRKL